MDNNTKYLKSMSERNQVILRKVLKDISGEDCEVYFDGPKYTYYKKRKPLTKENYVEVYFNDFEIHNGKLEDTLRYVDFMSTRSKRYLYDAYEYFTKRVEFSKTQIENMKSVKILDQKLAWKKQKKDYEKILKFVEERHQRELDYCMVEK